MDAPVRLDAGTIIRRSKARRLPAQIAVGSVFTLAIAGIGVAGVSGVFSQGAPASQESIGAAEDSKINSPMTLESELSQSTAANLNLCGEQLADVAPHPKDLELIVGFPAEADRSGGSVRGVVTLVNNGTDRVSGVTAMSPAITLSQDGVVLWHSNGAMRAMAVVVDLEPGESMEYEGAFWPVHCETEDDLADSFGEGLPVLEPGVYELSAAIDLALQDGDDASTAPELITGPQASIELR
jgi:hypothetical protein